MSGPVLLTWLVRYAHVAAASLWVGGYALLTFLVLPRVVYRPGPEIARLAVGMLRFLTYTGTATLFFGVLLIGRTRGYGALGAGEWGVLVGSSLAIAVTLLGVGDGVVRPALRRFAEPGMAVRAQRWTAVALLLAMLALGLVTRAVYAGS